MSVQIDVCACGAPVIFTFAFRGREFICLDCGRTYEFFGPEKVDSTPELAERHAALKAEWVENAGAQLLCDGGYHADCAKCESRRRGPHRAHATDQEIADDIAAREWLSERAKAAEARP